MLGFDCFTEILPAHQEVDVRARLNAMTPADVSRIRRELIAYTWKAAELPRTLPLVETDVQNPYWMLSLRSGTRVDRLTVSLDGFETYGYLYVPTPRRHQLVILHHGHGRMLAQANIHEVARILLDRGYDLVILFPPGFGQNNAPPLPDPDDPERTAPVIRYHDAMFALETPELSPIRYFLEPVVQIVNYVETALPLRSIDMIGISGGGWTTTLVAAIDPRIRASVPVAGSLPRYLLERRAPCPPALRDREQYHPPLYAIAGYLDLYVLGAYGEGRGQLQVLNQFDSCCFSGVGFRTYRDIVRDVLEQLGSGRFDVFLDDSHRTHQISRHAMQRAILPFLRRPLTYNSPS